MERDQLDSRKEADNHIAARFVLGQLWIRLKKDSMGTLKRGLYHLFVGRFKYARDTGYDAPRFWQDRFERCGFSLASVTDEGFSEAENEERYRATREKFVEFCEGQNINFSSSRTLEIGCGTGFYTQTLCELGVKELTGVDITDVLFNGLRESHPGYQFIRKDITTDKIEGSYDLVVMIDVVQHIVNENKLQFAMENIKECLANDGVFVIAPLCETSRTAPLLYFLRMWSLSDVAKHFDNCTMSEPASFRDTDSIIAISR